MSNKFKENEVMLCFHGPLIYEAKCRKFRCNAKNEYEYLVHYSGWSKKWDEWVPEKRVLKHNEANLQMRQDLIRQQTSDKKKTKVGKKSSGPGPDFVNESLDADSRPCSPAPDTRGKLKADKALAADERKKKMRLDTPIETETQFLNKVEVKIKIPDELKPWLVDDNVIISKMKKLAILPAKITVEQILANWIKCRKEKDKPPRVLLNQNFAEGYLNYFNAMVGTQLLYKDEIEQYKKVMSAAEEGTQPSAIYGSAHFLRLFCKLGHLLTYTALSPESLAATLSVAQDLLKYVARDIIFARDDRERYNRCKVIGVRFDEECNEYDYLVHYDGFGKRYDEWVGEGLVAAEADLPEPPAPAPSKRASKNQRKSTTTQEASKASRASRGRGKKAEDIINEPTFEIILPHSLQKWIDEDWSMTNNGTKRLKLPADLSVKSIIENFEEYRKANPKDKSKNITQDTNFLLEMLELGLRNKVLTANEQQELADYEKESESVPVVQIFGAHHLLRFLQILPALLTQLPPFPLWPDVQVAGFTALIMTSVVIFLYFLAVLPVNQHLN